MEEEAGGGPLASTKDHILAALFLAFLRAVFAAGTQTEGPAAYCLL